MQSKTFSVPAGQAETISVQGKFLSVKSVTLPALVSLDGGSLDTVNNGTVLPSSSSKGFSSVTVKNPNAVSITITYFAGDNPVNYAPSDNQQKLASSYPFSTDLSVLTLSTPRTISGTNNGHQRKSITFFPPTDGNTAQIRDASGQLLFTMTKAGNIVPFIWETDAIFQIGPATGTSLAMIVFEIYFSA